SMAFHTERECLARIRRNAASGSEVICGPEWDYSQNRPSVPGEIHQTVNYLVQCTVPTCGDQQVCFACFRGKPFRVSLFPSHSHFDAMPGLLFLLNRGTERVIACDFAVENKLNFSTRRPGLRSPCHGDQPQKIIASVVRYSGDGAQRRTGDCGPDTCRESSGATRTKTMIARDLRDRSN